VTAPLSLIVTAFAPVADVRQTLTPQLRTTGRHRPDPGRPGQAAATASAARLAQVYGQVGDEAPDVDDPEACGLLRA
jgi:phosphoribosylformylglycinamidine synthase